MADDLTEAYFERLATFSAHWDGFEATARQLAALGHVCDRPPLEALDQGSHCVSCDRFVKISASIQTLEGPIVASAGSYVEGTEFHHPKCIHLQVYLPFDRVIVPDSYSFKELQEKWQRRSDPRGRDEVQQSSSLFSLPPELRLEIYSMILPKLEAEVEIVQLNKDSMRVVTKEGSEKRRPRDLTKINILATCLAVHDEALDNLYTKATFKFGSTKVLYLFLRHIGSHGRQLLKAVDVVCGGREDALAFALLATCKKLTRIVIRCSRPVLLTPGARIWMVDGVACLLSLSGIKTVDFEPAVPGRQHLGQNEPDVAIIRQALTGPNAKALSSKLPEQKFGDIVCRHETTYYCN